MKILQVKTGNAIYPLWWNFFANAFGKWEFAVPVAVAMSWLTPRRFGACGAARSATR
jgi:hypothetical protein